MNFERNEQSRPDFLGSIEHLTQMYYTHEHHIQIDKFEEENDILTKQTLDFLNAKQIYYGDKAQQRGKSTKIEVGALVHQ